jgi:uncharacterized membrane protein YcaP (DUF421 family)
METPIRAFVGYFLLLLVVRLLPRRPGAQMTQFEVVIIFLIGGVVIRATLEDDTSITNCGVAIVTVVLVHNLVAWLKLLSPTIGILVDGTPLVLLEDGAWRPEVMDRMRVAPEDVMAAARAKDIGSLRDIRYAILERNGAISVIPRES